MYLDSPLMNELTTFSLFCRNWFFAKNVSYLHTKHKIESSQYPTVYLLWKKFENGGAWISSPYGDRHRDPYLYQCWNRELTLHEPYAPTYDYCPKIPYAGRRSSLIGVRTCVHTNKSWHTIGHAGACVHASSFSTYMCFAKTQPLILPSVDTSTQRSAHNLRRTLLTTTYLQKLSTR